jgi:hypothetical protein
MPNNNAFIKSMRYVSDGNNFSHNFYDLPKLNYCIPFVFYIAPQTKDLQRKLHDEGLGSQTAI